MRGMKMLSGYARYGFFGALLSVLLMASYPTGAVGQDNSSASSQYCTQIINQYQNAVAGNARASGEEATAMVAAENNASLAAVQNCVQGNGNVTGVSAEETGENTRTAAKNVQNCIQIVNQYNNVVAGDAVASGDAAIAAVAAKNNATIDAVQNCVQGDGNVVGGGEKPPEATEGDKDRDNKSTETEESVNNTAPDDMVAGTGTNEVLSNTGGFVEASPAASVAVPVGAAIALSGLAGMVWITRRPGSGGGG